MSEVDRIARAGDFLFAEMEAAHAAFVRVTSEAERLVEIDFSYADRWQAAVRLMKAQAGAANALKRLSDRRDSFTFTYIRQGTPGPKKLKTTVPLQPALSSNLRSETADAAAVERA